MDTSYRSTSRTRTGRPPRPSVSHTSCKAFATCERSWLYRYQSRSLPEPLASRMRFEARIAPTATLAGTCVDLAITQAMAVWHAGGPRPTNLYPKAERILREILVASRAFRDAVEAGDDPGWVDIQPVETTYYRDGWDEEKKDAIFDTMRTCLENFVDMPLLDTIEGFDPHTWRLPPTDCAPWFWWPDAQGKNIPVYAKYDFAIHTDEQTIVFDWKSGSKDWATGVTEQMATYVAYACAEWGADPNRVEPIVVWLAPGEIDVRRVSPQTMALVREMYGQRHAALTDRLAQKEAGADPLDLFPMAHNSDACRRCTFRDCPGYMRTETAQKPQAPRMIPVTVEVA